MSYFDWFSKYKSKDKGEKTEKKSKYKSSLGWRDDRLLDSYYSSYRSSYGSDYYSGYCSRFYGGDIAEETAETINETERILTKAYKATRDMIVILDFPFNVDVTFRLDNAEKYELSDTTRRIFIPTTIINDKSYAEEEKVGIFCGLGVHEAAHLRFTSYKIYSKFIDSLSVPSSTEAAREFGRDSEDASARYGYGKGRKALIRFLVNAVEDERVEDCLLKERPGYSSFIEKAKFWSYKKTIDELNSRASASSVLSSTKKDLVQFLINIYRAIRYPDGLDVSFLEKYSKEFEALNSAITEVSRSTKHSCIIGYKIYTILEKQLSTLFDLFYDEKTGVDNLSSLLTETGLSDALIGESIIAYGSDGDSGRVYLGELAIKIDEVVKRHSIIEKLVTGTSERGKDDKTFFEKPEKSDDGKIKYLNLVKKIKPFIPAVKKVVQFKDKNYEFSLYGCRSGLLDTNKLAEAYQGVPQVYVRKGQVTTQKTTVCVLVDESGSMCGEKECIARQAAVLINEALKKVAGVDLYIYGHTADTTFSGSTNIFVYKEGSKLNNEFALPTISGKYENRDGVAIKEVAARVRKHTSSKCLMFVISDGSPCASEYHGSAAAYDVKKEVDAIRKDGFEVVQVTIDGYLRTSYQMFGEKNVIDLRDDLSRFPIELSKVIKGAILNNMNSTTTLL